MSVCKSAFSITLFAIAINGITCTIHGPILYSLHVDRHILQIPVSPGTQIFGFVLDSRLTWEPLIGQVRTMCYLSPNVLRDLSGASWGAAKMTVFAVSLSHLFAA